MNTGRRDYNLLRELRDQLNAEILRIDRETGIVAKIELTGPPYITANTIAGPPAMLPDQIRIILHAQPELLR